MKAVIASRAVGVVASFAIVACGSPSFEEVHGTGGTGGADASAGGESGHSGSSGAGGSAGKGGSGGSGARAGAGGTSGTGGNSGAGGNSGSDGGSGTGATAGTGGDGGIPPDAGDGAAGCDESASPTTEKCLVSDKHAVFVAAGAVNGTGTMEAPVATITAGIARARQGGLSRVIVCNATYLENVVIEAGAGVSLYGGFSCPTTTSGASDAGDAGNSGNAGPEWTYTATTRPEVAPATGSALKITAVTTKVVISDLDLTAADAGPGASAIGAIVANSTNVTLLRVKVTAGKGGDGAKGGDGTPGENGPDAAGVSGRDALCTTPMDQFGGKWGDKSACGSQGGPGGTALVNNDGASGVVGTPTTDLASAAQTMVGTGGTVAGPATDGPPGSDGANGTLGGVASSGLFSATGYTSMSADGKPGVDGHPGQGGSGGGASKGSSTCAGASGGAGGMGGCGGTHGDGGKGGGASVALLVWDSVLTLNAVELKAADGGKGGNGGNGATFGVGKKGGDGGAAVGAIGRGGDGGRGGNGGTGGSGSGASGGPSYGLVYHGTKPTETVPITIAKGTGGALGNGGSTLIATAPDGLVGASAERFPVTP